MTMYLLRQVCTLHQNPPQTASVQAAAAREKGIRYLDAPVSGGEPGARDGTLAIMAGGDSGAFADMQPVFTVFGRSTLVGPAGAGSLAKLANQVDAKKGH